MFQCVFSYRCFDTFLDCKVHESDEQTVFQCFRCKEEFESLDKLTEHETEHKENKQQGEQEARTASPAGQKNWME